MEPIPDEINIRLHIPGLFASIPYQWILACLSTTTTTTNNKVSGQGKKPSLKRQNSYQELNQV